MDRNLKLELSYPAHMLDPESILIFIEASWFEKDWKSLGLDVEWDLWCLQTEIMFDPKAAPVIQGTNGLRKMRFSPPSWNVGKSGALRICYVYYEDYGNVLLTVVYPKGVKDSLSDKEKKAFNQLAASHKEALKTHYYT